MMTVLLAVVVAAATVAAADVDGTPIAIVVLTDVTVVPGNPKRKGLAQSQSFFVSSLSGYFKILMVY
jgi:hypothetical protein